MRDRSSIKIRELARLFEPPAGPVSTRVDPYDNVVVNLGGGSN